MFSKSSFLSKKGRKLNFLITELESSDLPAAGGKHKRPLGYFWTACSGIDFSSASSRISSIDLLLRLSFGKPPMIKGEKVSTSKNVIIELYFERNKEMSRPEQ